MNRVEFNLLNQAYNASIGRARITKDINLNIAVKAGFNLTHLAG